MLIISSRNKTLKNIRRLRRCKGDLALLEGPHLVEEAVAAGLALEEVLATPEFLATPAGQALCRRLPTPPVEVDGRALKSVADADSPQGVLAVAALPRRGVEALAVGRTPACYLYVDGLQDPGNLGALARVAEAAGCAGMALSPGTVHPNHPRALRASAGSLLRLPVACGVEPDALRAHLEPLRFQWICLAAQGGEDLYTAPLEANVVLTVGAEGPGLRPSVLEAADLLVTIPLAAPVESLNATVAASLALFEVRRRNPAGHRTNSL